MLNSAFLRRTIAAIGLGAAGVAPVVPFAALAVFGAAVPSSNLATAAPVPGDPIPHIDPRDVDDLTGGIGIVIPPLPPPPPIPVPGDIDDGTGGIGGGLP